MVLAYALGKTKFVVVVIIIIIIIFKYAGWDSSVGIATHYGLGGLGIESQWGVRFSAPLQTGAPSLPFIGYRVIPGGKVAGVW
jgi:hypothetical protein